MSRHKRKAFFDTCVRAYQNLTGDSSELYIRPVCGFGFTQEALQKRFLTLEHIPPKSLGGKPLLLTCKQCNNTAGHKLDSALHLRQCQHNYIKSITNKNDNYERRVKLNIAGEKINYDLSIKKENGFSALLVMIPKQSRDLNLKWISMSPKTLGMGSSSRFLMCMVFICGCLKLVIFASLI